MPILIRKIPDYLRYICQVIKYIELEDVIKTFLGRFQIKKPNSIRLKDGSVLKSTPSGLFMNLQQYKREKIDEKYDIFSWDFDGILIYSNNEQVLGFYNEYVCNKFQEYYDCDFNGKVVLDIGGFAGDGAKYFFEKGAKRVIIYEPVHENVVCLNYNLSKYKKDYVVYEGFVCAKEGYGEIKSDKPAGSHEFGDIGEGMHVIETNCFSLEKILKNPEKIDIAKLDCEGCELYLERVKDEAIMNIEYWIIEFHFISKHKYKIEAILNKFAKCGYIKIKEIPIGDECFIVHLQKKS